MPKITLLLFIVRRKKQQRRRMFQGRIIIIIIAVVLSFTVAVTQAVEPIWLSPINTNYDLVIDFTEQFPPRGVWTKMAVGAGARSGAPILLKDSKGSLWIMFGYFRRFPLSYLETIWNYDPKADLYRWVAGPGNGTDLRDPGVLQVPAENNFPGGIASSTATIDHNDNIWFTSFQYCCELWMFNTTSYLFTRVQGNSSDPLAKDPNYGNVPGQPGPEVSPGQIYGGCFVTDSSNNLWLIAGYDASTITNRVWHFNTTSLEWTFISGNDTIDTSFGPDPYFGGRIVAACDIDENDRVWVFGGEGSAQGFFLFSDMWTFDTRTKQWQLEHGSSSNIFNGASIVSKDFSVDNYPSAKRGPALVNRNDGTLILVGGGGVDSTNGTFGGQNDIWLFNKTSKSWKIIYGDPTQLDFPGNFTNYRAPGSELSGRYAIGRSNGLNLDGDVYIIGGEITTQSVGRKELWLVPYDQCSNNAHKCSVNAQCIEEMIGYSCACSQGYIGDGFTCTVAPPTSPLSPSSETPSFTPSTVMPRVSSAVMQYQTLTLVVAILLKLQLLCHLY